MMRAIACLVGLGGAVVFFGCGIGNVDSLFVGGGSGGAGGAGGGTQSGGGQPGVASGNPTTGGQGGTPTTSVSASNASSSQSSSQSSSAMSSSSTGVSDSVQCGDGLNCPGGPAQACCWDQFANNPSGVCVQGTSGHDNCNVQPVDNGFHVRIECQLPSQCPGRVCCGHRNASSQGSYYDRVDCESNCENGSVTLCDPNGPETCPGPLSCQPSQVLPNGYFICGN